MKAKSVSKKSVTLIGSRVREMGLDPSLLYEAVIELADEGMLTARSINAAAEILVSQFGLPPYYFQHITKAGLKNILQVLSSSLLRHEDGRYRLSARTDYLAGRMIGGVRLFTASESRLKTMESVACRMMNGKCWEYYFSPDSRYHTYIIKERTCPDGPEAVNTFAFMHQPTGDFVPAETGQRYEDFLQRQCASMSRLIEFTAVDGSDETRIMFHKNISASYLPVIRKLLHELGLPLGRAYGETYRTDSGKIATVCSLYVNRPVAPDVRQSLSGRLQSLLSMAENPFADLYLDGRLGFHEMLFAVTAAFFVHHFIYRESETDRKILDALTAPELCDAFARRIVDGHHSEYTRRVIREKISANPDLIVQLFQLFDAKFNPFHASAWSLENEQEKLAQFRHQLKIRFINDVTALEIFRYMTRLITETRKTNFYLATKRSFSFRLTRDILDPLVFPGPLHGVFFVVGHYSIGTHMRAADIARGGLRLLRVTPATYEEALDDANLLNYALGPRAQRLKHKDIAENGAKGVIIPTPEHARDVRNAVFDYTAGMLDLLLPDPAVIDYLKTPEMIFFGPDEGTANVMDAVAAQAKVRGYEFWRTLTSGKSIGLPHDAFGMMDNGKIFALQGEKEGTKLEINGEHVITSHNPDALIQELDNGGIRLSGMTTAGVMTCYRTLLEHCGEREETVNLMLTGGPDGDLGANQIQCTRGRICLIIDSGGVLFDPAGLDRRELLRLAMARHLDPRPNTAAYPQEKLSEAGFFIAGNAENQTLPDGTIVEDGAYFHRNFLTDSANRERIAAAHIQAFIPCGGFKDTINYTNVRDFLKLFRELRFIVEGANIFFDDPAREIIARESEILQIRDSSANKGGVTASSLAEILSAFILGDHYEEKLVKDPAARFRLAGEIMGIITENARAETTMLLDLHRQEPQTPLYQLSTRTSEQLLAFQDEILPCIPEILADSVLTDAIFTAYIPDMLIELAGLDEIRRVFSRPELQAYRDAILSKKPAAMALYQQAGAWDDQIAAFHRDPIRAIRTIVT